MPEVLLTVDTSTPAGSIAISRGEALIGEIFLDLKAANHTDRLLLSVSQLLSDCALSIHDVTVFGVVVGPGSFTGLRVGLATIKGLAMATGKPVVGVSSLRVLAASLPFSRYPVCVMVDARKKEVYSELFSCEKGRPESIGPAVVADPEKVLLNLESSTLFVGNGAILYRSLILRHLGGKAHFAPWTFIAPRASMAASLLLEAYLQGEVLPLESLAPLYIRLSEAEIAWARRQENDLIQG
ncbi:tRNA (adenosine(37)-N6)-threonylcarbamoyltransferase complex dimerization subunit type 1 TsaB [Desulfuromonas sp. AOP6]|uniref:tRNA (adenosine(37)-N6)-threonylcarbamoyltransferase complex dimerization subunit type 1 TsaB n=1 Tax=Desulfuromonas sp. AOP6 TaxID=1566351 RepID=UPI00126DD6C3|nr:tRNA (adenosine(37)-N6)-threonylcarbamoyltransferase complex dimerization subunit type 1 TsaB [Desulfuromonas sp. AOP6]BCA79851.1 tRNa (adenosine (37)-N6)-threonylcarbamoyltransferase complex dimerization subunit type 1 TsaB [Desulfuromonas sp. AOP6]